MNIAVKIVLIGLAGCTVGLAASCTAILDFTPDPSQCWCGEQWRVQIAGAKTYDINGSEVDIPASETTYTRCVSMREHLALDEADPLNPLYMALRDAFESEAIANCEIAGAGVWPLDFDHTDCAMTGTDPVTTNLVYLGPCWESEDLEAQPNETCPLEDQCGHFYDCSDDPIILYHGQLVEDGEDGETGGPAPWGGEELWSCDEPVRVSVDGPDDVGPPIQRSPSSSE